MQVETFSTHLSNMNSYLWKLIMLTDTVYFFSISKRPQSKAD